MRHTTVTTFFALLALASFATVGAVVVLGVLGRRIGKAADLRDRLASEVGGPAVRLAAVVASVATLGSLYLSEVIGYPPCTWCWVQRGFMYPLAVVLVVASATGWDRIRRPAIVWALVGAGTSAYHMAIERVPALQGSGLCDPSNPCAVRWVQHFGFVTIPVMAFAAFLLIAALLHLRPPVPATRAPDELEMTS
jgi:disulfide bond formation protein DsbB